MMLLLWTIWCCLPACIHCIIQRNASHINIKQNDVWCESGFPHFIALQLTMQWRCRTLPCSSIRDNAAVLDPDCMWRSPSMISLSRQAWRGPKSGRLAILLMSTLNKDHRWAKPGFAGRWNKFHVFCKVFIIKSSGTQHKENYSCPDTVSFEATSLRLLGWTIEHVLELP